MLSVTGVAMLLVSRGHYSIDCLVAYWVTSRVWWTYHTMANNSNLKLSGSHNHMDNIWWWYVFRYAENNVTGKVPRRYSLFLPRGSVRRSDVSKRSGVCGVGQGEGEGCTTGWKTMMSDLEQNLASKR